MRFLDDSAHRGGCSQCPSGANEKSAHQGMGENSRIGLLMKRGLRLSLFGTQPCCLRVTAPHPSAFASARCAHLRQSSTLDHNGLMTWSY